MLFVDQFDDGKERRILRGWDPDHPVQLSPMQQKGIAAILQRKPTQRTFTVDPAALLLLKFRDVTNANEKPFSLRELVQRAKDVELRNDVPKEGGSTKRLLCLRIWRDVKMDGKEKSGRYFDVFLDPKAGMMARKLVNHHDQYDWPGEGKLPWAEWVHEVMAFHDAGEGAFFPIESEWRIYRSDLKDPTSIVQIKPKAYTVNKVLSANVFDFRFPENATVMSDEDVGDKRHKVYLWGPNNEPARTITTKEEILKAQREYDLSRHIQTPQNRRIVYWTMICSGALLFVVIALWRVRLRKRRTIS